MLFEFLIAFRYLFTKKKERFVSVINAFAVAGIALGVTTLIVVMSVMNGYEAEIIDKFLGIQSHITLTYKNSNINGINKQHYDDDYRNAIDVLRKNKNILYFAPVVEGKAAVQANNDFFGIVIRGVNISDVRQKPLIKDSLVQGSWSVLDQANNSYFNNSIIIGIALAQRLGVSIGGDIKVIIPSISHTILGEIPRTKTFKISGIFDVGRYDYNEAFCFISLSAAQVLYQKHTNVDFIEIVLRSLDDLSVVHSKLNELLGQNWYIKNWRDMNNNLVQALSVERNVMFLILSLIILIAAFNIISSLMILVKDKHKSIAVLRTMGAKQSSIMMIFIICGLSIGVIGTTIGCILGLLFALNIETVKKFLEHFMGITLFDPMIYFLTTLPSKVYSTQVLYVLLLALTLSFLATIYPAIRISRLSPSETLRCE